MTCPRSHNRAQTIQARFWSDRCFRSLFDSLWAPLTLDAAPWPQVTSHTGQTSGQSSAGQQLGAQPEAGCNRKVRAPRGPAMSSCFPTPHPQSSFREHAGLGLPLLALVLWVGRGPSRPTGYPMLRPRRPHHPLHILPTSLRGRLHDFVHFTGEDTGTPRRRVPGGSTRRLGAL